MSGVVWCVCCGGFQCVRKHAVVTVGKGRKPRLLPAQVVNRSQCKGALRLIAAVRGCLPTGALKDKCCSGCAVSCRDNVCEGVKVGEAGKYAAHGGVVGHCLGHGQQGLHHPAGTCRGEPKWMCGHGRGDDCGELMRSCSLACKR
eukprot:5656881-Prymnesium_polylepis.1